MTNKNEFDVEIDETEDLGFDETETNAIADDAPRAKKSGGGFLVKFIVLLLVIGGGVFSSVKYLGVKLPFDVPGLTTAAETSAPTDAVVTADANLDAAPPQPVAADDSTAAAPAGLDTLASDTVATMPTGLDGTIAPAQVTPDALAVTGETDPWGNPIVPAISAPGSEAGTAQDFLATTAVSPVTTPTAEAVDPFASATTTPVSGSADPFATAPAPIPEAPVTGTASVTSTADMPVVPVTPVDMQAAAVPVAAHVDAEAQKKIAALEQKVSTLESELSASQKKLQEAIASADAAQAQVKSLKAAAVSDAGVAVKSTDTVVSKPVVKKTATKVAPAVKWVLRSAKQGQATVSEQGSNELRSVSVGDSLSGIGKVTAIAQDATGRWVVNGTRGKINQ